MKDEKDLAMEILDIIGNQEKDANGEFVLSDGELLDIIYLLCKGVIKEDNSEETRNVVLFDEFAKADPDDHEYHNQRLREIERGQ